MSNFRYEIVEKLHILPSFDGEYRNHAINRENRVGNLNIFMEKKKKKGIKKTKKVTSNHGQPS